MDVNYIVSQIDGEIARLTQVKGLLEAAVSTGALGSAVTPKPKVSTKKEGRRKLSDAARARISAAQKARWAKAKAKKV
jgi:hypothetical protein